MEDNLSYRRTAAPLLAPIFRSDGQARLLAALLLKGDELSITDLAERTDLAYPTVHREVAASGRREFSPNGRSVGPGSSGPQRTALSLNRFV